MNKHRQIKALTIDDQSIKRAISEALASQAPADYTVNQAVVMGSTLRETLNKSQQKIGNIEQSIANVSFNAAGWSETIKLGNKCFRAEHANPLDTASHEKWFWVRCS